MIRKHQAQSLLAWLVLAICPIATLGCSGSSTGSTSPRSRSGAQTTADADPAQAGQSATRTCVRVVDGDTIVLDSKERVRYIGIDTPETVHPSKPVQWMGKEASTANRVLVEGKQVRLEYDAERTDKYGRTLAYVWVGDTMVNERLVQLGFAQVSTYPPNVRYVARFQRAQREAREASRGLWGPRPDGSQAETPPDASTPPQARPDAATDGSQIVYITRTGKRYHRESCRYLSRSKIPCSLKDAIARGFTPCKVCRP